VRSTAGHLALAAVVGLSLGALTQVGQGVLPDGWRSIANSITPWLAVAFLTGSVAPGRVPAAAGGIVTLLGALVGYYGLVAIRYGYGPSLSGAVLLWLVAAVVGGPVFGLAGHWWRGPHAWRRAIGPALLGAAAIAEGVYLSGIETVAAATPGFVIVGLALPVVLGRSREDRVRGLVALVPCIALGAAGFVATLALYGVLTGI
jgi:uncharacterized membrane protein (GlpM family)